MEFLFLRKKISRAPMGPGVYIFTDLDGKNLYIGKASSIRVRLSSYLKTTDDRILKMLSQAINIKTIETGSEIEALITESQYIKKHKPMFNIMLRDDKQFSFVGFTKEEYPKIFITHQPTKVSSIKYKVLRGSKINNTKHNIMFDTDFIGPFTDTGALKTTLRYLRKIFPYCTCRKPHNNFCLNYHIEKCPGFCCLKNPKDLGFKIHDLRKYLKNIRANKAILSGKKNSLLKNIEREMIKLGKEERFNEALKLRNKIEKIKKVFENAIVIQHNANPQIHANATNNKHYDTSTYHSERVLRDLKSVLELKNLPRRIEGYDIANIQGQYAVGGMAVFTLLQNFGQTNCQPLKSEYRKFKIRGKQSPDDTAMLKEILIRRFNHSEWPKPDLILVDGGKQQLKTAEDIISPGPESLKFKQNQNLKPIPIVALTKDEKHRGNKIYLSGNKKPILLAELPASVKNLLLHIDAEAHRFAIDYYRRLHRKGVELKSAWKS